MSILLQKFLRLLLRRPATPPAPADLDSMALRDWADLPPHHPASDCAPC